MADAARPFVERLLRTPNLAKAIPQLQPQVLHRVIQFCGLDACAEIVALATPAQIERVLDADLWRAPAPGRDEAFDASRFGAWLDVLMQAGEDVAAKKLAGLDLQLVVAGFSQHVLVFDLAAVMPYTTLDGNDIAGRSFDNASTADVGGFVVEARRPDAWDTIVSMLAVLNVERPEYFRRLMRACVALSSGEREEDASHSLLDDRNQDLFDLASSRDARRDAAGYVTPADARAFLHAARALQLDCPQPSPDPLAHAYFRSLACAETDGLATAPHTDDAPQESIADAPESAEAIAAVMDALNDAGVVAPPRALLTSGDGDARRLRFVRAYLESTPSGGDELAYLTNVAMSGGAIQGRPVTAREAPEMVSATCNLGLEAWPKEWPAVSLVAAFQVGWTILYRDVCLYAAESLVDALAKVRHQDRELQLMINQLRRELIRHGQAGAPWRARDAFDAIMMLDTAAWAVSLALIDETPALHRAADPSKTPPRTIALDDVAYISSRAHVAHARAFMERLDTVRLSRE